jgi:lambda repressor-like predicted transcriptional regulator
MPWSETDFRARVLARADELGKSWPDVARAAHVHPSTLSNSGRNGRMINKIEDIAQALDWSVCEILGCGISLPQLVSAVTLVCRSRSGLTPERASQVVRAYEALCARERDGRPVDQSYLDGLSDQMG